jgi:IclR family acetate operon transcriptional repressor
METPMANQPRRQPSARRRAEDSAGGVRGSGEVQSLTRGLVIIERLAEARGGATLTVLAQRVGLPSSTVHRLLKSLESMRFVRQDADRGRWFVGLQAFKVGNAFLQDRDFVQAARPIMQRLMEASGETANLGVLDDGEVVTLSQVQCNAMMRMLAPLGARAPVHASALGKAMLASLPPASASAVLNRRDLTRVTANTIVSPAALTAELEAIRRRGFAIDDEEHAVGLRCVAATLHDEHGDAVAAVSLSGPKARVTRDRVDALGGLLLEATAEATTTIGGCLPAWRSLPLAEDSSE